MTAGQPREQPREQPGDQPLAQGPGDPQPATAVICLHRPAVGTAGLRRVQVLLDGQVAALLGEGDTVQHRTTPGVHRLWAHLDWASDQQVDVELAPGEQVELHVVPDGAALSPLRDQVPSVAYRLIAAPGSDPLTIEVVPPSPPRRRLSAGTGLVLVVAVVVLVTVVLVAGGLLT